MFKVLTVGRKPILQNPSYLLPRELNTAPLPVNRHTLRFNDIHIFYTVRKVLSITKVAFLRLFMIEYSKEVVFYDKNLGENY